MVLLKREYHRFIEVYHWSLMQAVSTFTESKKVIFINFPEFAINYPDSLLSYGNLHP